MPGISRVGLDTAGATIVGPGEPSWTLDGFAISLVGDAVAGHGLPPHAAPVMVTGSPWTINGKPIVRRTSLASCGHTATGHPTWSVP